MKNKENTTLFEHFSIAAFVIGLLLTALVYFFLKQSLWVIGLGLIISLGLGYLYCALHSASNKRKYIEVLERYSDECFQEIMTRARDMLVDPAEVESVHKLRVAIRRFRAVISLAKYHMDLDRYVEIQDFFRQRGRELADLREMDVLIESIHSIPGMEDAEMIDKLRDMRLAEQVEVVRLLDEDYIKNMQKMYEEFIDEVKKTDKYKFDESFDDRLEGWDKYIVKRLPEVNDLPWSKVHRVRIKSKKARYISEIFDEDISDTYSSRAKEYKKVQSNLGERCDQLRNQEAIDEWIKNDSKRIKLEKSIYKRILDGEVLSEEEIREILNPAPTPTEEDVKPELADINLVSTSEAQINESTMTGDN